MKTEQEVRKTFKYEDSGISLSITVRVDIPNEIEAIQRILPHVEHDMKKEHTIFGVRNHTKTDLTELLNAQREAE